MLIPRGGSGRVHFRPENDGLGKPGRGRKLGLVVESGGGPGLRRLEVTAGSLDFVLLAVGKCQRDLDKQVL